MKLGNAQNASSKNLSKIFKASGKGASDAVLTWQERHKEETLHHCENNGVSKCLKYCV
jgi:hypothetical protein